MTQEVRVQIGERLKEARMKAGLTVTEVAEALGKNKNTVYSWELGRILPTAEVFLQVITLYGIKNLDVFLGFNIPLSIDVPNKQSVLSAEELEITRLYSNANEQGKSAAKAVLQSFQNQGHNVLPFNNASAL